MQRKGHLRKFVPFEITNFLLYNNLPDYASNHPNHQDNPLPHGTFCWYLKMTQYDLLVWQWPYFRLISPHKNPKSKTYGANGQLGVQKVWKLAFGLRIHRDNRILKAGSQKGILHFVGHPYSDSKTGQTFIISLRLVVAASGIHKAFANAIAVNNWGKSLILSLKITAAGSVRKSSKS